jgi:PAS domain S-box-containing protein
MSDTDRSDLPEPLPLDDDFQPWCDAVADGLLLADLATQRLLVANAAICRMLGHTEAELLAMSVRDLHPEDEWPRVVAAFASAQAGGLGRLENIGCLRKDGTVFSADVTGSVVTHRGRRCALGLFRDVTAQRHAVELLELQRDLGIALGAARRLDEALRLVLEAALRIEGFDCGGIYLVDPATGKVELKVHAGLSREFVEAASRYPPDSPEAAALAGGRPLYGSVSENPYIQTEPLCREGLRSTAVIPLLDEGRAIGSMNVGSRRCEEIPISSRHALETMAARLGGVIARIRSEEARRESERRYRLIAENVSDVIWTMELGGLDGDVPGGGFEDLPEAILHTWRFTYLSPSIERLLGYPPDEAMALRLDDILTRESYQDMARLLGEDMALEDEEAGRAFPRRTLEIRLRRKDGAAVWCEATVAFLRDAEGRPSRALGVVRDITDRREAAETVMKEQQMLRRLLDLHERDRQLTAYEIHDGLTQQLTGSLYQFEAASRQQSEAPQRARQAFDEGMRLVKHAIAEARRLISGLRPPVLDEAGIVVALEYVVCEHRQRGGPEIEFHAAVGFERLAPPLETAIFRIVQESLSNACRHSGSDRVRVALSELDGHVHLDVSDWGGGFDPQHVDPRCFGLRGILERARLLGGRATFLTAPGKGTRIHVELPILRAPAQD